MTSREKLRTHLKAALICIVAVWFAAQLFTVVQRQRDTVVPVAVPTTSVESSPAPLEQALCTATVKARLLNQRSGPGESYSIVGGATTGEVFTVQEWNDTRQWLRVNTSSGSAWMYARYVTLGGTCTNLSASSIANNATVPEQAVVSVPATATPDLKAQSSSSTGAIASVVGSLAAVFTPEVQFWAAEINAWATAYQMDPNLIATVIQIESCGDPSIHSTAGAQGLFQVMPFHFGAGEDMLDIETNARRGLDYLKGALKLAQGDAGLALVGYNGGYGAISGRWAAETQQYYYWGSHIYSDAVSGATSSPTLQAWLAAGGANLCSSASRSQQALA